ncbi:TonB-dependent receptor [Colwellia sp. MSW7]|uniref:TonB-dependent receptor n=1 Tax=Colwellia maritima TaxID=2912588 RepID=A0ABS9X0L7_9GAMM|nr:TonB-dependent receptor [Colwellia maritima]MCI2283605.1 TonB-dependent receptor [Colwellia maritima]
MGLIFIFGTVAGDGSYEWDFINRESSTETSSYDLDMNYTGGNYTLHAQIGMTEASGGTYNETSWSFVPNVSGAESGYSFDLSNREAISGVDPTDGSKWKQNWTWGGNKPTTDEESYGQLDLNLDVDYGPFSSVDVGIKYRDHDRSQGRQAYSWHAPGTSNVADGYMWWAFDECPTLDTCGQTTGTESVADNVVNGNLTEQRAGDREAFMQLGFGGDADYAISDSLGEIWDINESILSLYAQGNFSGDSFRGNVGVRVVQTSQTASSYNFSLDSWGLNTVGSKSGNVDVDWLTPAYLEWVTEKRDYTEVLPSFNIAFDATENQIVRFGAARVMSRPNYSDLAPIESVGALNVEFPTGTSGNPDLKPQIADQFDVTWEWYFDDSSVVSVAYFYKDIQSYRTTGSYIAPYFNEQDDEWVDVTINRPDNGLGGSTDGLEIGYQQAFGNFGLASNYTYTNADSNQARVEGVAGSGLVEGASDHMFNATAYYENETFGARLMYNYRTEWYKGVSWTGAELWNKSYGQLDFSSSYTISENFNVVFEAVNLTDEEVIEYDGKESRLMSVYQNGRRFVLGLNVSF